MRYGNSWGGAIEVAVCARVMGVVVQVFERKNASLFVRISRFDSSSCGDDRDEQQKENSSGDDDESIIKSSPRIVNIVYGGRCHYDALELSR